MIRDACVDDVERLASLLRDSFEPALHPYMTYAQHGIGAFLRVQLSLPWASGDKRFLVSERDGEVVGFTEVRRISNATGFLSYICVDETARGEGVATSMIAAWLRDADIERIELDVFAHNLSARGLYARLGFVESGTSQWVRRQMPNARSGLKVADAHVTEACMQRYGFATLALQDESVSTVGLLGQTVVRLPALSSFSDDALLGRIAGAMSGRTEALVLAPAAESTGHPGEVILDSIRMTADAATVRRASEGYR